MADCAWNRAADSYEQSGVEFVGPLGRELVARAGLRTGDRVLDVGCGRGHVLFPAAAAVGPRGHVIGVDLAPRMVARTAAELRERNVTNASVVVGDGGRPAVAAGSVDAVLAGFVMFLLPDPGAALRAYHDALVAGGRLALSTYARMDVRYAQARAILRSQAGLPPVAEDVFDQDGPAIARFVESNGFRDVTVCDVPVETRVADDEQWWAWAWSTGLRAVLEKIPADRLVEVRPQVAEVLAGARQPDGSLVMTTRIRYTTGRRG